MFGSHPSPTRESEHSPSSSVASSSADGSSSPKHPSNLSESSEAGEKRASTSLASPRKTNEEAGDKKRKSSGVAKASALFATAKHSLHLSHTPHAANPPPSPQQTAMQKLGKTDPALSVPQGSLNNSAGESHPGPRSTFRVGVTEDKNKKCRRTMEDTHAYLYNFLSTPSPLLGADAGLEADKKSEDSKESSSTPTEASTASQIVETDNGYFAIFDGHAGTFAADWCGKKLHIILEEIIRKNPNSAIPELLDQTFTSVDTQLTKLPLKNSGCTAICAVLRWEDRIPNSNSVTGSSAIAPVAAAVLKAHDNPSETPSLAPLLPPSLSSLTSTITASTAVPKLQESASRQRVLYTANVGDARIVLCRNGKALRLSYDHKGSDENEGRRITNAGGLILNNRVNGVLAVTRALGDAYMKELVTGHPYTTETVIQPDIDEFLILACDGLWDVCTDQEAVDLVRETKDPQVASKQLVDHALARFSTDNLSCMVVRFDKKVIRDTVEHITEPIGVDGDVSSSNPHGISEADAIVREARKNLNLPDGKDNDEDIHKLSDDIILEHPGAESGPDLNPASAKALEAQRKEEASKRSS